MKKRSKWRTESWFNLFESTPLQISVIERFNLCQTNIAMLQSAALEESTSTFWFRKSTFESSRFEI
eukprot:c42317_g1_i1 orf=105-302(+)